MMKTHTCGELREKDAGTPVSLAGWVNRRRDQGGLIFIDLRDRWGITQVVVDLELAPEAHAIADSARNEYVLRVVGKVRIRPEGTANPELPTGDIDIVADEIVILNESRTPPFYINRDEGVSVLLVEQNSRMALSISNRAYAMTTGNVVISGQSKELLHDERIKAAYLGGDI